MWTFFEDGTFYSAVVDRDDKDWMVVRTRDRRSIDRLASFWEKQPEILEIKGDYRFRVWITRAEWQEFVDSHIQDAKATNFKSQVSRNVGYNENREILDALHDIWSVMYDFQTKMRQKETRASKGKKFNDDLKSDWHGYSTFKSMDDEEWDDYIAWVEREHLGLNGQ